MSASLRRDPAVRQEPGIRRVRRVPGKEAREFAKAFGRHFRIARLKTGLSQETVALAGDFDRTYISLIERGQREPRLSFFIRLCETVNASPVDLLAAVLNERARALPTARGVRSAGPSSEKASEPSKRS